MRITQILRKLLEYSPHFESKRSGNIICTVAGPDLQIRGAGGEEGRSSRS